jgi:hypothetical protein
VANYGCTGGESSEYQGSACNASSALTVRCQPLQLPLDVIGVLSEFLPGDHQSQLDEPRRPGRNSASAKRDRSLRQRQEFAVLWWRRENQETNGVQIHEVSWRRVYVDLANTIDSGSTCAAIPRILSCSTLHASSSTSSGQA